MTVNWNELLIEMSLIKNYDDLRQRWQEAFAYEFVCQTCNYTIPDIANYTRNLLGTDSRNRYIEYTQRLVATFNQLHQAGVRDIVDLVAQVDTCAQFELFAGQNAVNEKDVIAVLKYLVYWFVPMKKQLSGLVTKDSPLTSLAQSRP